MAPSSLHASKVLFTLHLFLSFSDGPTELKFHIQFWTHFFKRKAALKIFEVLSIEMAHDFSYIFPTIHF
jgi:hypothetical protein